VHFTKCDGEEYLHRQGVPGTAGRQQPSASTAARRGWWSPR